MIHLEVIRIVNHQNYFVVLPVQHAQPVYVQIKQLLTITAVVTIYIFVDQAKCATILNASQNVKIAQQQIQTAFVEKVEKIFVNQAKCATILNASQNVKIAQQQISKCENSSATNSSCFCGESGENICQEGQYCDLRHNSCTTTLPNKEESNEAVVVKVGTILVIAVFVFGSLFFFCL